MYDKRIVVESTLRAMGLDHTRLPVACDPDYRHTVPSDEAAVGKAHSDRMNALMAGAAPPRFTSGQLSGQSQRSSCAIPATNCTTRTTTTAMDQQVQIEAGRVYRTPPTPTQCEYRRAIPVSRQAARDAYLATEHNANGFSMGEWYVWCLSLEIGESLFNQQFPLIQPPEAKLDEAVCEILDNYPFGPENTIVRFITADMLKNPLYQPPTTPPSRPNEPEYSPVLDQS